MTNSLMGDVFSNGAAFSRRSFLRTAVGAGAALTTAGLLGEAELAFAQSVPLARGHVDGAVYINANENPLGPSEAARNAALDAMARSGRYCEDMAEQVSNLFAAQNDLKPDYVQTYSGSTQPLHYSVLAFCGPERPFIIADPGYEAGMMAAQAIGAPVSKVPLAKDYAHDVRAMCKAAPNAGLLYLCSPNNPTGTVTSRADVEYALANKPKGSILLLDEAYIHFSDQAPALDLVAADKDIIILRTFSKIYGMAGMRLGFVIARPDLQQKIFAHGGWSLCPVPAMAAGIASLKEKNLIPQRKQIVAEIRNRTFDWLTRHNYDFVPSESNCFMLDTKQPGKRVIAAMQQKGVFIGRIWPAWPNHVRITIGTTEEMARFQKAFDEAMHLDLARVEELPGTRAAAPFAPKSYRNLA